MAARYGIITAADNMVTVVTTQRHIFITFSLERLDR
jgi:hypothetical protein